MGSEGKFNAEKIKHIPGQEGHIAAPAGSSLKEQQFQFDKAHDMAIEERNYRETAREYAEYLKNPDAFDAGTPKDTGRVRNAFKKFAAEGLTEEYMNRAAEHMAELVGACIDYQKSVRDKSTTDLALETLGNIAKNLGQYPELMYEYGKRDVRFPTAYISSREVLSQPESLNYEGEFKLAGRKGVLGIVELYRRFSEKERGTDQTA